MDNTKEMGKLAQHLTEQVGYNNQLLQQVQQLEQEQLMQQKLITEKQLKFRQALAVSDAASAEVAELRRKLAVSQEVAQKMEVEGKKARIEATRRAREVEQMAKEKRRFELEVPAPPPPLPSARARTRTRARKPTPTDVHSHPRHALTPLAGEAPYG